MEQVFFLTLALLVGCFDTTNGGFLNGDCQLKYLNGNEVSYMEWVYDLFLHPAVLDTTTPGTEIARFTAKNIEKITGRYSTYVSVELAGGYLILIVNEEFSHFEEQETEPDIKLIVEFECKDGGSARIAMWGTVQDTNNHKPEFGGSPPYIYTLPLPYPPSVPLSCVTGVAVSAIDIDLSTTRVDFQVTDSDALQVTGSWKVGRTFYANITTARYITAAISATLRATDNGVPTQYTEVKLHVMPDWARSLPAFAVVPEPEPSENPPSAYTSSKARSSSVNEELNETLMHSQQ